MSGGELKMLVQFARVGDGTTTGGTVLTGSDKQTAFGKQISTIGDQASCPKCGHIGIIVEGSSMVSVFGKAVAIDGSLIACGCPLGTNKIVTIPIPYAPTTTMGKVLVLNPSEPMGTYSPNVSNLANNLVPTYSMRLKLDGFANRNANTGYKITMENGQVFNGTTDAQATTQDIVTYSQQKTKKIEIIRETVNFFGLQKQQIQYEYLTNKASAVTKLNQSSIIVLKENDDSRPLTSGEITMAKKVFREHINYSKVKIHDGNYLWVGQADGMAMTPDGDIYFSAQGHVNDFSSSTNSAATKAWFIHEMTHVWQYQSGVNVRVQGLWTLVTGGYGSHKKAYSYYKVENYRKKFTEFNIEQQASIVGDYFLVHILKTPPSSEVAGRAIFLDNVVGDFFR